MDIFYIFLVLFTKELDYHLIFISFPLTDFRFQNVKRKISCLSCHLWYYRDKNRTSGWCISAGYRVFHSELSDKQPLSYKEPLVVENKLQSHTSSCIHIMYRVFIKYCVFSKILIFIPDSVFSRCQFVYTHQTGRTPALQEIKQS